MKTFLTKRKGESDEHFRARMIFAKFLESKYKEPMFLISEEYPPYRPKARGDIVVIKYIPPRLRIEMWVEVQESPLNASAWHNKLSKIRENFNVKTMVVVLTERTRDEALTVTRILRRLFNDFSLFLVDLSKNLIFEFDINSYCFFQVWRNDGCWSVL